MPLPTNKITIAEFRSNYEHYIERMDKGETFFFIDYDDQKTTLDEPLEDGKGLSIDTHEVKL